MCAANGLGIDRVSAQILDGKMLASSKRLDLKNKVDFHVQQGNRAPSIAVILIGQDPASTIYVSHKIKACAEVGIQSLLFQFDFSISERAILNKIQALNADTGVDGILVQLPLPPHINKEVILLAIDPLKDVDGFHPENIGLLAVGAPRLSPATPRGIMQILDFYRLSVSGLHAVIVGASNIVGRPMALELLNRDATVTICHSKTQNLESLTQQADLLIAAAGVQGLIRAAHVKLGAVVIDVGMHRSSLGQVHGDVQFDEVCQRASWISPVPGGVGPMTIIGLLENTLEAAAYFIKKEA